MGGGTLVARHDGDDDDGDDDGDDDDDGEDERVAESNPIQLHNLQPSRGAK